MNSNLPKRPLNFILKPFLLSLFLSLFLLAFFSIQTPLHTHKTTTISSSSATAATVHTDTASQSPGLRIRHGYSSYASYIERQLNKTLNPKLRELWTTRDWDRKVRVFAQIFQRLKHQGLLFNDSKALCIGARVGQEVAALKGVGVDDSLGIDLAPYPPLVLKGDFHHQPFDNETFDFEFSNVFDHALYPGKFVGEIERTLKPGGVCVLHVAVSKRTDKYSANDLYGVGPLLELLKGSDVVEVRGVDAFGLDTELIFRRRKKKRKEEENQRL